MLILKITPDDRVKKCRIFGTLLKRQSGYNAVRYNITVNGSIHTVVEMSENELYDEQLTRLFKAYAGKIIVPEKYAAHPVFEGKLFDDTPYKCFSAVSSLINYLKSGTDKRLAVCLRISGERVFEVLDGLLPFVKSLTVVCEPSAAALAFLEKCYISYGVKPFITSEKPQLEFDINADFTAFEENGRSIIEVFGKTAVLYPDPLCFADGDSFETFVGWGINRDVLCAALSKTRS